MGMGIFPRFSLLLFFSRGKETLEVGDYTGRQITLASFLSRNVSW